MREFQIKLHIRLGARKECPRTFVQVCTTALGNIVHPKSRYFRLGYMKQMFIELIFGQSNLNYQRWYQLTLWTRFLSTHQIHLNHLLISAIALKICNNKIDSFWPGLVSSQKASDAESVPMPCRCYHGKTIFTGGFQRPRGTLPARVKPVPWYSLTRQWEQTWSNYSISTDRGNPFLRWQFWFKAF